jgi:hypothetical protein
MFCQFVIGIRSCHQQRSLNAQKATLLRDLEDTKEQTRMVRIKVDDYAISIVRQSISNKEDEMKEIDGELGDSRIPIFQMESTTDNLRVKIAHSDPEIAPMKRKQFDSTRPIGAPTMAIRYGSKRNARSAQHDRVLHKILIGTKRPLHGIRHLPCQVRCRRETRTRPKESPPKEREPVSLSAHSSGRFSNSAGRPTFNLEWTFPLPLRQGALFPNMLFSLYCFY